MVFLNLQRQRVHLGSQLDDSQINLLELDDGLEIGMHFISCPVAPRSGGRAHVSARHGAWFNAFWHKRAPTARR